MSTKSGFFTLNRFLGKKNKENKLTKSTSNLSTSITMLQNIDESSQQNRITPLPTATSNAPFEQTFRITVLLPKGQMYVVRLGARVQLSKLLELVCENKQLEKDKYEFKHSVDSSQVFSCESTIGAVGLTEIRLCEKSDAHHNFNSDEILKLKRTVSVRDSLSSSELSSRYSKTTQKTASPYSSSNSLNSMDSTGMNTNYRGPVSVPSNHSTLNTNNRPVAPARKKRTAPPPPVYCTIPEKDSIISDQPATKINKTIPRKNLYVSSPNLSQTTELSMSMQSREFLNSNSSIDCNGNKSSQDNNNHPKSSKTSLEHINIIDKIKSRPKSLYSSNQNDMSLNRLPPQNALSNMHSYSSVQNISIVGEFQMQSEPSPKKKIVIAKKKAAPAPPPRVNVFLSPMPVAQPRSYSQSNTSITEQAGEQSKEKTETKNDKKFEEPEYAEVVKRPSRDILEINQKLNIAYNIEDNHKTCKEPEITKNHSNLNISKIMLNRSPTPEQHSDLFSLTMSLNYIDQQLESFDTDSKHADSGIGETVPSPPPDSLPSENPSPTECKSPFESSSEDEEQIKVYNLKLGKKIVKSLSDHKTLEDDQQTNCDTSSIRSEATTWNFTIPAPPNFADSEKMVNENMSDEQKIPTHSDIPITPIFKERPKIDFDALEIDPMTETVAFKQMDISSEITTKLDVTKSLSKPQKEFPITNNSEIKSESLEPLNNKDILTLKTDLISKVVEKFTKIERELSAVSSLESNETEKNEIKTTPSLTSAKSDVFNELSNVLVDDGVTGIHNNSNQSLETESLKRSSLKKCSVQKYSKTNLVEDFFQSQKTESSEDEEKIYRKRSNASIVSITSKHSFQSRHSISRSDSFHSTQQQLVNNESLPTFSMRSASYLSLQKLESDSSLETKFLDTNVRKSSSELSIGESPSLQSLIVIKSILNSRKNSDSSELSANNLQKETEKSKLIVNREIVEEINPAENEPKKMISQELRNIDSSTKIQNKAVNKTESNETIWRYSGPPSINFSTWSERPKVKVSIKNEGDYICGTTNQTPASPPITAITTWQPATSQKPLIIRKSMPVTNNTSMFATEPRLPFVRSVEYKKTTLINRPSYTNLINGTKPPAVFPKPVSQNITSTMNKISKTTKNGTTSVWNYREPVVNGFTSFSLDRARRTETPLINNFNSLEKADSLSSITVNYQKPSTLFPNVTLRSSVRTETANNVPLSPTAPISSFRDVTLRRSTQVNVEKPEPAPRNNQSTFPQFTLRKTGLKEKILANYDNTIIKTTTMTAMSSKGSADDFKTTTSQCVPTNVEIQHSALSKNNVVYTINVDGSEIVSDFQIPPSCPPPLPPTIRAVVTKQSCNEIKGQADDLLNAIRSFNLETLKRT